jgi:hypothetical protein
MIICRQTNFRLATVFAVPAALIVWLAAAGASAEVPWQPCGSVDREGVTLEKRPVPGSKFYEYRASALTTAPAEAVLRGIWTGVTEQLPPAVKQRTVLSASAAEILFYDQLKTPVVSDRDFTMRISWSRDEQTGVIEVPFVTVNDRGPPPAPGLVRVPAIRGDWIITPLSGGPGEARAKITFLCYSDPGGSIPAFMARGAQQSQVLVDIHRILARALIASRTTAAR